MDQSRPLWKLGVSLNLHYQRAYLSREWWPLRQKLGHAA